MSLEQARRDHVLVALNTARLDRIRLMKTLFLVSYERRGSAGGPFTFKPYLYGPCAFDLYETLDWLQAEDLVMESPALYGRSPSYYLTEQGRNETGDARERLGDLAGRIEDVARWSAGCSFRSLLTHVYGRAPEYAVRSVVR